MKYYNIQLIYKYILMIYIFSLCAGTIFFTSSAFVNTHITPKKYCAVFGILFFCIFHVLYFLLLKKNVPFSYIYKEFFLIINILCT